MVKQTKLFRRKIEFNVCRIATTKVAEKILQISILLIYHAETQRHRCNYVSNNQLV